MEKRKKKRVTKKRKFLTRRKTFSATLSLGWLKEKVVYPADIMTSSERPTNQR